MKKILIFLLLSSSSSFSVADSGILFLAHGSMTHHHKNSCDNSHPSDWEKKVLDAVESIKPKLGHKSEVAFGMWSTDCFDAAIARLERSLAQDEKKLDELIVLPLFISSFSEVIEMQKFIFKKRMDRVIPIPSVTQTYFTGKISYLPAIDYNSHIGMILANRFHELINSASEQGYSREQMELVLVMHGPVTDSDNLKWMEMGQKYVADVTYLFPVKAAHVISLRDDAPAEVRNHATQELRKIVMAASQRSGRALVLPLLLSSSGIEQAILKRLEGLDYVWSGEMILPDTLFPTVILDILLPTIWSQSL